MFLSAEQVAQLLEFEQVFFRQVPFGKRVNPLKHSEHMLGALQLLQLATLH